MKTQAKYSQTVDASLSEEVRVEAMAWRIYDILYNSKKTSPGSQFLKHPSQKGTQSRRSSNQVEDLFDMLHLEA